MTDPKRNSEKEYLARAIRRICREKGWTQAEFARRAGLKPDVLSTWLNLRSMATLQKIKGMAHKLGVDPEIFLMPHNEDDAPKAKRSSSSHGGVHLEILPDRPAFARIEFSAEIPSGAALKIIEILNEATGKRDK